MALLDKTGIVNGNTIESEHVSDIYNALNGTGSFEIIGTGSFTGSFAGNGSQITGIVSSSYAVSASYAISASYEINYETSSSYAETASISTSSSFATTASFALNSTPIDLSYLQTTASFNNYTASNSSQFAGTASFSTTASFAPNFANTNLTFNGNRSHSTAGNTLTITDGTNDRFEILASETVFNDSGADIDFRVESDQNVNALLVDASTNQVRIGVTGSKSTPSLYLGSDSNTGFYNSGSNGVIYITTNGTNTARISTSQLIVGDENFKSNQNYGGVGLHVDGWLYTNGSQPIASNVFYNGSQFCRGLADKGGFFLTYLSTGSSIDPANGEKIVFVTIPSGSITGSEVSQSVAYRVDVNYYDGVNYEPNFEIANRLTLGKTWFSDGSGTELQRNGSGQIGVASSDERLKTNIQTLTSSLNIVQSLNGVRFNWTNINDASFIINNTGSQIGLIAQQVEQVLPEIVKFNGIKDYKTIDYDKIVAVLIEAIKEQQQQIDDLQQQINNL